METVAVLAGGAALLFLALAVFFPDIPCRAWRCEGGKVRNPWGRGTRPCYRCGGRGRKTRFSRKVWDKVMRGSR